MKLNGFYLILHNIRSAYNVGSIFRTADAIGVEKIFLCGITPTPEKVNSNWSIHTGKAIKKTALGAEKSVAWQYYSKTIYIIKKLKAQGVRIVALEQTEKSKNLFEWKPYLPLALILGNELKGIPSSILKESDEIIEIPMLGKKESLNVSVSFAVVGYYIFEKLFSKI